MQGRCCHRCPVTLGCRCHLGEYLPIPNVCSCGSGQDGPGGGYVAEALAQDEVGTADLRPLDGMRAGYPAGPQAPRAPLQGPQAEARDRQLEESHTSLGASKGEWPSGLHCGSH